MTEAPFDGWAEFYDLLHRGLPGEAEFYVGQAVRIGGDVLELGCGTGRLAIPMALSGVHVVGVDNSAPMLEICHEKMEAVGEMPGAVHLVQADMRDLALEKRFDLVVMAYRTFMHLLTPADQLRCLRGVGRHLKEDGLFMMNVWVPKACTVALHEQVQRTRPRPVETHAIPNSEEEVQHLCETHFDEFRQLLIESHVLRVLDGTGATTREATLPMVRTWTTPRELDHLLHRCGFEVEALFGDFDCGGFDETSTEMIWVLRKGPAAGGGPPSGVCPSAPDGEG